MSQVKIHRASELRQQSPGRLQSLFTELDMAYGRNYTIENGEKVFAEMGLPRQKVSLWAGVGGAGKSRACLSICKNMSFYGMNALYILNEDDPNAIAGWVDGVTSCKNLFIVGASDLESHTYAMWEVKPDIVVVDSLTGMPGINSPTQIRRAMVSYKRWAVSYNCHIILIAHINKKNEIKGNNDITFFPDHICILRQFDPKIIPADMYAFLECDKYDYTNQGYFLLTFEKKNRGGVIGHVLCFKHVDVGVQLIYGHVIGHNA